MTISQSKSSLARLQVFVETPCVICKAKPKLEVKIARVSNHIYDRAQVCSISHAIEWLQKKESEE